MIPHQKEKWVAWGGGSGGKGSWQWMGATREAVGRDPNTWGHTWKPGCHFHPLALGSIGGVEPPNPESCRYHCSIDISVYDHIQNDIWVSMSEATMLIMYHAVSQFSRCVLSHV